MFGRSGHATPQVAQQGCLLLLLFSFALGKRTRKRAIFRRFAEIAKIVLKEGRTYQMFVIQLAQMGPQGGQIWEKIRF